MKKQIKTLKIPKCPNCKKLMEVSFTTEQEKKSKEKPKVLICLGKCEKCKTILVFDLIKVNELPSNPKELMNALKLKKEKFIKEEDIPSFLDGYEQGQKDAVNEE